MKNSKKKEEKKENEELSADANKDPGTVLAKPTTTSSAHAVTTNDHTPEKKSLDRTQSHQ